MFQDFNHLKMILNLKQEPNSQQDYNYGEDAEHQYLSIIEPMPSEKGSLQIVMMKQHHCKTCLDSKTMYSKV